ncbi:uncharacterized protein [Solanum lycopersicum]|uniref:uncharacterized protein n=1 Tax=Solanum lycopersicum TaxID=4081 RepID=UPI003747C1C8
MSNRDIREALIATTRAVTMQANLNMMPRVVERTMKYRLRDFVRMTPHIFLISKVNEDLQEFLDGVYKLLSAMGVTSREKAELASYQLRDVAQIWYTQWKDNRAEGSGPIEWEEFKEVFLGMYFHRERREIRVKEFINLKQGNMSVVEYSLKFSTFSRYSPSLVSNSRDEMSHFVTGGSQLSGGRIPYRYVA